ncbi:MAG: GFA family protein [Sphingomonas sp.]|uniref:GFA family protein n=1 Tax=Sphingomonas sp. TaxID=28214 RepID=UPI0025E7D3E7|nr:GFA family protein [Sphingomonas sp.]MBX9880510.1 GFA family protein [Sphingomonas sp.]
MSERHSGGCLCGAVRITVEGPLGPVSACHCAQCRRQSGHYWAATEVPRAAVRVEGEAALRWYQASPRARRGFCGTCGSFLLWQLIDGETIDVAMGALDAPSGTALAQHIFVAEKGDYYTIADGLPQRAD